MTCNRYSFDSFRVGATELKPIQRKPEAYSISKQRNSSSIHYDRLLLIYNNRYNLSIVKKKVTILHRKNGMDKNEKNI